MTVPIRDALIIESRNRLSGWVNLEPLVPLEKAVMDLATLLEGIARFGELDWDKEEPATVYVPAESAKR